MVEAPCAEVAVRDLAALWANRLEGDVLTETMPDQARDMLRSRLAVLDSCFVSKWGDKSDPAGVYLSPVAEMLRHYAPMLKRSNARDYAYVLAQAVPAPLWSVVGAVNRVKMGDMAKPEFPPIPGVLRKLAWAIAAPFWTERIRIVRLLAAKPPRPYESPERRREVANRILSELQKSFTDRNLAQVSCSAPSASKASLACSPKPLSELEFPDF
jgi:hypothetical protein